MVDKKKGTDLNCQTFKNNLLYCFSESCSKIRATFFFLYRFMKILLFPPLAEIQPLLNNLGIAVVNNKNCFHSRIALHEISILITAREWLPRPFIWENLTCRILTLP
jgi:hypothetical protein